MDRQLTLVEHLNELRKRIIISLAVLGIATACSVPLSSYILKILKLPAAGMIGKLAFFSPQEAFLIYFRLALISGLVISMPVIFHQLWVFIYPAIEERAKRYTIVFILFSSLSFVVGCLFAYFLLIPPALRFLLDFAKDELEPVISASKYISFVISIIISCGFVFQMPMVSFLLTKLGVINHRTLRKQYKYAVVIVFIVAAIITPTVDVFNMLLLAGPMLVLYEVSIWISFLAGPKPRSVKCMP